MILYTILGKLLYLSYVITNDYFLSLVVFTLFTKLILFPMNIAVQKNGIKMVKMTPELNNIKCDFFGDKERISEETLKLYKKEHYSLLLSLLPLIIQLALLMGVLTVVRDPVYSGIGYEKMISLGLDLSYIPSEHMGVYLIFPLFAAVSALALCIGQNKSQVLQAEQGALNKYGMTILSTALSLYLGFFVSAGVAVYWIFSNLFSWLQIYLLNIMIDPKKHIDYDTLEKSRKRLEEMSAGSKKLTPEQKKRERADYKRFFSIDNKHIVFYSESSGFYKYFRRLIAWLTSHSSIKIHYVTSDPDDVIFDIAKTNAQILPYFIGETRLITLFMKMDAKIVVMTMPDLDSFHIKRSYVKKDIEYIFMDHALSSLNMTTRKGSVDHFDTIFCSGEHIRSEMRAQEKLYGLPQKQLVNYGYGLLDDLYCQYNDWVKNTANTEKKDKFILLAPSHQKDNILDSCLETVVDGLKRAAHVVIRPHPQYIRRYPDRWNAIVHKYENDPDITIQSDFSSNDTIYMAETVVTDWSNIGYEFAFSVLKPVIFVNTPIKIINPDYKDIGVEPIDITIRSRIGIEVSGKEAEEVYQAADKIMNGAVISEDDIVSVRDDVIYNFMHSDETGGRYILSKLKNK